MDEENNYYRFRSIDSLFGEHQELQNQEIFFSDVSELNDPMEGHINFYWLGDAPLWANLLKHYVLCLEHMFKFAYLTNEDGFIEPEIPVFTTHSQLPTQKYKSLIDEILNEFYKQKGIRQYIDFLGNRKSRVFERELIVHLKMIHNIALCVISKVHHSKGLSKKKINSKNNRLKILSFVNVLIELEEKEKENPGLYSTMLASQQKILDELDIITAYNIESSKGWYLFYDFPNEFIKSIKKLVYSDTYLACFTKNCRNSSLWGYYTDNHRGVCLIFSAKKTDYGDFLFLNGITGYKATKTKHGPTSGNREFKFKKVNYENVFPEVPFFQSLGRLPLGIIDSQWYKDYWGNQSTFTAFSDEDIDEWRKNYWNDYIESFHIKLKDWSAEKEYRLMLSNTLNTFENTTSRKFKYDFEQLEGIIFGCKTSMADKIKIIKKIEAKCIEYERHDFSFYQAEFYENSKDLVIRKLEFIHFSDKKSKKNPPSRISFEKGR